MAEKGLKKWIITLTVIMASLLELIDTTIVNVSLPQIMGNLGATLEDVGWVVTSYAVANVIVLPMSGWLSSKLGQKNYLLISVILFTSASFFCGNATSLGELILFRIIQGLAGGGLLSTAQVILRETWPPEELGTATALFGLGVVVGPTIGPTIGGYITDHFSWPWIFYVNIPIGAVAAFLVTTFVPESHRYGKGQPIDWWGIALLTIAVGSLQTVLERGESEDWFSATYIAVLTVAAIVTGILFVWRELIIDYPVVDFRIMLRYRSFTIGMFTSFVFGIAMYGSVFVFPILCQNLLGFSAQQTGEILIPGGLATICMMPFVGIMLKKGVPAQILSTIGIALFYVFTSLLSQSTLQSGISNFFWPLIIRGVGLSLLFVPLTTLAIQDLKGKDLAQGTGLNNMMRQLGGSFGIAIITTLIHIRMGEHRNILIEKVNPYDPAFNERFAMMTRNFLSKGYSLLDAQHMAYGAMEGNVVKQSMLLSYTDAFWAVGLFLLCCIPLLYLQKFRKGPAGIPTDAH